MMQKSDGVLFDVVALTGDVAILMDAYAPVSIQDDTESVLRQLDNILPGGIIGRKIYFFNQGEHQSYEIMHIEGILTGVRCCDGPTMEFCCKTVMDALVARREAGQPIFQISNPAPSS